MRDAPIKMQVKSSTRVVVFLALVACHVTRAQYRWSYYSCNQVEGKCQEYFLGRKGLQGDPGDLGSTGSSGLQGPPGPPGPKGFSYIVDPFPYFGPKGRKGDRGPWGARGDTGIPGQKGQKGDPGYPGNVGPPGNKGSPGFAGTEGVKGAEGSSVLVQGWKTCVWNHDPLQQYGLLKECEFNKSRHDTLLHVVAEGSMRIGFCTTCCKKWYFTFNSKECPNEKIEARLEGNKDFAGMGYRHVRLEGYCAHSAGQVTVELWVEDCLGHTRVPPVPWKRVNVTSRVIVEEVNLYNIA